MLQSEESKTENVKLLEVSCPDGLNSGSFEENINEDLVISLQENLPAHSSNLQAFFTLFKSFIGSAIFTLPYSFRKAGTGLSAVVTVFVGLLTLYCLNLAVQVADSLKEKKLSLEKLAFEILGKKGMRSVEVTLMIMQLGICTGIFILAGQFLDYSLCVYQVEELCQNTLFKVLLFAGLTIPLSLINNAHYFYIPSLIGSLFILLTVLSQVFYDIELMTQEPNLKQEALNELQTVNFEELPLLFGVATYAFEGMGTLFSIRSAMKTPKAFPKLILIEIVILIILLLGFATICSLALGSDIPEIVLFSMPRDNAYYLFVQIGIVISNLISYPIQFFPAVVILENSHILRDRIFDEAGKTKSWILRYGARIFLIAVMITIANVAKSFNLFLNILGSCVFTYIGYILPVWLYQTHFKKLSTWRGIINWLVVLISVVLGSIGTVMAIIKLASYKEETYE